MEIRKWATAGVLLSTAFALLAAAPAASPRKTAIIVQNRAGAALNDKVTFLEDLVIGKAREKEFAIVSREDVIKALKVYPTDQPGEPDRNSLGTKLDRLLSDNTSALRLAQNMNTDFILFVSLGSLGQTTRKFRDDSLGIAVNNTLHTLRLTYKLTEGVTGSSLGGDSVTESKTIRQSPNLVIETDDVINELLEKAAVKVADGLAAKAANFKPAALPGRVEISIAAGVKDLQGNEISLPDIRITEDNQLVKGDRTLPVQASATIEMDGFALGTTPAKIKVLPGAHKLRLTRPGFDDVELTINATEGLSLSPTMQMSAAGYARWKDIRTFLNALDMSRLLTDARAEEIRGNAQRLRQSGFLVDFRVNTTEAPKIIEKKSIYSVD